MKPDCFIAFDWPKFQASTAGMRREHKWSYWNAICAYYWGDCLGLDNSDDFLKQVCECFDSADWARTKGTIFKAPFFELHPDGRWHQKRAKEEYQRAQVLMERRANQTKAAREARARPVTEAVTVSVTERPTPTPTPTHTETPSQTQKDIGANGLHPMTDLEWLVELQGNPAYVGLNVEREFGKMTAWCSTNRKQPNRRRFINWLNRADAPMKVQPAKKNYAP